MFKSVNMPDVQVMTSRYIKGSTQMSKEYAARYSVTLDTFEAA